MKQHNANFHMKAMTLLLFLGGLALTGCGSSSTGGGGANGPGVNGCIGINCPNIAPIAQKSYYAQSTNMPSGGFANNGSSLNISNAEHILESAMGVCNRGYYNGGLADCRTWNSGFYDLVFMVDQSDNNKVNIIFRAYPQVGSSYYTYNLPRWDQFFMSLIGLPIAGNPQGVFNPMILQGTIHPVNQSQGFEIRAYGPQVSAGYNKLIQIQVANGKIEDERFRFNVFYNGSQFGSGTMVRCQTPTCGL